MKLHRHARPDAGVSSSAAPIANSDTRELRAVLGTPADLPALRTQHRLRGLVRRNACVILRGRPPGMAAANTGHQHSVSGCAPASSARVGDGPGPDRHECFDAMQSKEVLTGCGM